ncbi:alpha-L-arabinofuranosidase [Streptomyces fagopyri]|uniref:Alpha-L-arabinofuranosidase n=1 Tax=Streptomyces fagopyri TaxID=2662397 RepID=A0A5Q0LJH2_9ACTN|nr:AbfB domain-containing protein [Streptomyces fagopyri]QFZ77031.1 alpha-L-arabinofuranosidase [Streptomyces fagopyri]
MPEISPDPTPGPDRPAPIAQEPAWRPTPRGAACPARPPSFTEPPAPWLSGVVPDEERLPGTRRLWLAGGLAMVILVATAIAVLDSRTDHASQDRANRTVSDTEPPFLSGDLATATGQASAPAGRSTPSSVRASGSAPAGPASPKPSAPDTGGKAAPGATGPSKAAPSGEPSASRPSSAPSPKSIRSVNYPDRYWHLSNGYVRLDQVAGSSSADIRRDADFTVVAGLGNASCYSFATADGGYLRHRDFVLRADRDDGSALFERDATFCPRASAYSGAVVLESLNYPGRCLRHRDFRLRLETYDDSRLFRADSAFRMVDGLA